MKVRFALQHVIGGGRHGVVWLARDRRTGADVAVKIAARGALDAEGRIAATVRHPNLVQAIAHGRWDDAQDALAMAFAAGGSLATRRVPQPASLARRVLADVLPALAALHAAGWVHRDVKPAHLLLRAGGAIALADFGLACAAGVRAPAMSVTGTPRYAAPEQTGGAPASAAADIYSLGVSVFELLAGRAPFQGETVIEVFSQHLRARPPSLPPALAHWQDLLHAMLAKEPGQRPGAAGLAAALPELSGEFA